MSFKLIMAFFSILLSIGCAKDTKSSRSGTYLSGEIVNPTSNHILLRKNNILVDSIPLDQDNKFFYKLENVDNGLYEIFHNEEQLIYLESGDSLLLRVNTFEFDETLTFSGYGEAENNLMIQSFLQNEQENNLMIRGDIYQTDPETFNQNILKLKQEREAYLETFLERNEVSEEFEKIARAIIKYDFCARKEVYPTSHFGEDRLKYMDSLPGSFYDCRKEADFNDASLINLFSYQRFLLNYFNHEAYKAYYKSEPYNPQSFTHNLHKLRIIETKIKDETVESFLLTRTIKNYLANSNDKKGGETLYDIYMDRISSKNDKTEIEKLYQANKNIETGKRIPEERVINVNNDTLNLRDLIKKPTFIFFWSNSKKSQAKRSQALAESLIQKYPQYTYLSINVNDDYTDWINTIRRYDFDPSKQMQFTDSYKKITRDLAMNSLLKTFILDRKGFIINAHANIYSSNFENELVQGLEK